MKTIEGLGISPWPWHTFDDNWVDSADGNPAMSNAAYACNRNDAIIIAAAPELYEALAALLHCSEREAPYKDMSRMTTAMDMARKALAKAGGDEAK